MDTSPHSPGRKPFVGGARQLFNSGVNYKKIISSTPAVRAQRVLDRMPRNILDRDNQRELHSMMTDTFLAPGAMHSSPTNKASSSLTAAKGGPATISKEERDANSGSHMTVFDTFSYGFDLPAGVQLNRINKKLHFWEKTQGHLEERAAQRELWAKNILKKEHQKEAKMEKAFGRTARTRREHWDKRNEARYAKKCAIETEQKHQAQEVWSGVRRYYKEVEQFDLDKKEREKAIADRLAAYYNAASGAKADEDRKRIEAALKALEDGQTMNQDLLQKLDEREQKVAGMKQRKGLEVKERHNDAAD